MNVEPRMHQGNGTCFDFASKSLTFDRRPFLRIFVLLLRAFQTSTLNHFSFPFFFRLGLMCGALYVHRVLL